MTPERLAALEKCGEACKAILDYEWSRLHEAQARAAARALIAVESAEAEKDKPVWSVARASGWSPAKWRVDRDTPTLHEPHAWFDDPAAAIRYARSEAERLGERFKED